MRRFFIDKPLSQTISISGGDARHIAKVLRLSAGAEVIVTDPDGQAAVARLEACAPEEVVAVLQYRLDGREKEPPVEVWLAQGLPKADKMDYIVQKAVELGAAGIIPMACEFSVVRYDEQKARDKVARWQKIAREAAKQCGRSLIPQVAKVQGVEEILAQVGADTAVIMLYEAGDGLGLKAALSECRADKYLLLIGPEGGFSAAEAELVARCGARIVTMGSRILRTETAAVAALAVVMYEKGDLGGGE